MQVLRQLRIEFHSDFRIGSGFGLAGLVDHVTVKTRAGLPYIPGSTLKGRLRMACKQAVHILTRPPVASSRKEAVESYFSTTRVICQTDGHSEICKQRQLEQCCVMCRLFGSVFHPGSLIFSDALPRNMPEKLRAAYLLNQSENPFDVPNRSNIKVNRRSRVVEARMLVTAETVPRKLEFVSDVYPATTWSAPEDDLMLLESGARLVTHLGSGKARGLGCCTLTLEAIDGNPSD